jgi:DNA sulfur modification protein DndD
MIIQLTGWTSKGLRCPDIDLTLGNNGSIPVVSLLQMPNGTGKTTTLTMLRAAMTGEATAWSADRVRALRRPGETTDQGQFALHLAIDGKPLTLEVRLNFEDGTASYRTSSPGLGGLVPGWKPPQEVQRFFDDRFVRLFVFDGEFADRLLQPGYSEAGQAIDALFQLYLLEEIHAKTQEIWERAAANAKGAKTETGLTMYQNKASRLASRIAKTEKALQEATTKLATTKATITELDQKIQDRIGAQEELRAKLETAREREMAAENDVNGRAATVMGYIRQPHVLASGFATSLVHMKNQLDRLKLPASTSSQFFTELLQEDNCICGRPLDDNTRDVLKQRAALYLAEDTSGVLNTLKRDVDNNIEQAGAATSNDLTIGLDALSKAVVEKATATTAVRALRQKLIDQGDEELRKNEEELNERVKERELLTSLMEEINRAPNINDDENTKCLKSLRAQLSEVEKKVAEITGTIELRQKVTIIQQILTDALADARKRLRTVILEEVNDRLRKVLYRDPLEVASIDSCLRLKAQEGASVGQTLTVGYVFLTTLLNRGQHQVPLVIDSPANPLSIEVRREVGKIIPTLCKQFVAFTISSERTGFVRPLDETASGNIGYFTLFRKTPGTAPLMSGLPQQGVTQTDSGVLITGKEYFDKFDLEEEA